MKRGVYTIGAALLAAMLAGSAVAQDVAGIADKQDPAEAVAAGDWRSVAPDNLLIIDTNKGRILVEMTPEAAPGHVARLRLLAKAGFYDGIPWHRVIDGFMAQTGDPLGTGEGQSWYQDLKAEFTFRRDAQTPFAPVAAPAGALIGFMQSLPVQTQPDAVMATTADRKVHAWGLYCPGVAGMARDDAPDSANSQFFLMRQPYPALEKRYTIWGRVVSGLDVVRALKFSPNPDGIVTDPDRMTRVRVAGDLAQGERPSVRVLSTDSPRFRTLVERTRAARGADFSACDIDLPVAVD
ncbi:peptidylprolyl isomerase [Brevundimonas diminuta]|uniref:peptidylprolyl isomerase n=1 Tax=Brevundimonas diminuta TaxID=293 RepID=UPI002096BFE5|nr:peptidylprolyl isomerase [Brevundimonas diminuta]MCO8017266.1 peptidylprolyl isomerase [Brevundimonas diminuta]MCO8020786.1 peptidylprolyl isomerase [Brevundimonas diminuta]